jgi:hypothetical protein
MEPQDESSMLLMPYFLIRPGRAAHRFAVKSMEEPGPLPPPSADQIFLSLTTKDQAALQQVGICLQGNCPVLQHTCTSHKLCRSFDVIWITGSSHGAAYADCMQHSDTEGGVVEGRYAVGEPSRHL